MQNKPEEMTLRDYFAAHVIVGAFDTIPRDFEYFAENAYKLADAMLAERGK